MYTYTKLYKRAARFSGINITTDSQALSDLKDDINQANKMFMNASRRHWTRKEVTTNLVANQQFYTFPQDLVRATTVKVTSGGLTMPVTMIDSEETWNRINLVPGMTVGIPTTGFIRGRNEMGLYPIPAANSTNGLIVSYESRQRDMVLDDTTATGVIVTNNSVTVTSAAPMFNANMVGMSMEIGDGSDGNVYPIVGYTSPTSITLENVYMGSSGSGKTALIGSVSAIPEEYHLGLAYFAAYNYYLTHKDASQASDYKALFEDLMKKYIDTYAAKTTGQTQDDLLSYGYNLLGLPPQNITA